MINVLRWIMSRRQTRKRPSVPLPQSQQAPRLQVEPAGFFVRLAALVYDGLLLIAIYAVVGAVLVAIGTPHNAAAQQQLAILPSWYRYSVLFPAFVVATWLFFGWFWVKSGQTLGMQTWRLKLVRRDGQPVTWRDSLVRCLWALPSVGLGMAGYLLMPFSPYREALHDRLSGTVVVRLPKATSPRRRLFGWLSHRDEDKNNNQAG